MLNKRDLEGYLEINHKESPGITPELAAKIGRGTIPVGAGQTLKAATYKCPYCEWLIVRNPARERPRNYDPKTDRYICDNCSLRRKLGDELKPMSQVIDEFMSKA